MPVLARTVFENPSAKGLNGSNRLENESALPPSGVLLMISWLEQTPPFDPCVKIERVATGICILRVNYAHCPHFKTESCRRIRHSGGQSDTLIAIATQLTQPRMLRVSPDTPALPAPTGEGTSDSLIVLEGEGRGEGWAVPAADEESAVLRGEFENLWPLQLVDLRDEEMVGTLFRLLRKLPQVKGASLARKGWLCVLGYYV